MCGVGGGGDKDGIGVGMDGVGNAMMKMDLYVHASYTIAHNPNISYCSTAVYQMKAWP